SPIPVVKRAEPAALKPAFIAMGTQSTLMSAINVYDSTMFPTITPGSAKKVRITEGFSSEEGFPNMFGLTEFDGQARLGEIDVQPDGSFKAVVPANTPVRLQLIDKYGLAIKTDGAPGGDNASEPVWIQGRPGEARVCGGCHEDRTKAIALAHGSSILQAAGSPDLMSGVARTSRATPAGTAFTYASAVGVPWDKAIQPIFDAHCVDCHDGTPGTANPSYTVTDMTDMTTFMFTFNLKGTPTTISAGMNVYTYNASYIAMLGPTMAFREKNIMVTGNLKEYISPGAAHNSVAIQMLNPPQLFPSVDMNTRAFSGKPVHPAEVGTYGAFNGADPKYQLSSDEYYLLILNADDGGQFYFRENAPGGMY
ncbi:MAG TPA: hypothetical protein VF997_06050, partial [Polyangia bacterium]